MRHAPILSRRLTLPLLLPLCLIAAGAPPADATERWRYREVVDRVAGLASDAKAQQLAARFGMQVLNVLWEDTGRYEGSSVGPNISDVTIEVADGERSPGGGGTLALLRGRWLRDRHRRLR